MLKDLRKRLTKGYLDRGQPTSKLFILTGGFFIFIILFMAISPQLLETVPTDYNRLIVNGDFEGGYNLPHWRKSSWTYSTGGIGYPAGSSAGKHNGSWGCQLTIGEGYYHNPGWIEQDVEIGVDSVTSFSYWAKLVAGSWAPDYSKLYDPTRIVVTVTYTDGNTSTHIKEYETTAYQEVIITDLLAGKTTQTFRFECDRTGVGYATYIDDIILQATPPTFLETHFGINGFELLVGILTIIGIIKWRKRK